MKKCRLYISEVIGSKCTKIKIKFGKLSIFYTIGTVNKSEMLFVGKHISWKWLDLFGFFFFLNVCDSPNQVFRETKMGKVMRKIREKTDSAFSYNEAEIATRMLSQRISSPFLSVSRPEIWKVRKKLKYINLNNRTICIELDTTGKSNFSFHRNFTKTSYFEHVITKFGHIGAAVLNLKW